MRRRFFNISGETFDYSNYMTIEALDEKVYVSMPRFVEYGIDGRGWYPLTSNESLIIKKGQLVSFKGNMDTPETYGGIKVVGNFNLKGNCLSLVFGDEAHNITSIELYPGLFEYLFSNNTGLIEVEKTFLPATTLANHCYGYIFGNCLSLVNAPELPATTLASSCYEGMFYGCKSLTTAPELPATTLNDSCYNCYDFMFYGCKKLNYIKAMFMRISSLHFTNSWVNGVASNGTFVKNPDAIGLPTGNSGIPSGWTVINDGEE